MGYAGRYVQGMKTRNFGGIDKASTVINIGEDAAWDITNWDIGLDGSITRRKGFDHLSQPGDAANKKVYGFWPFLDADGIWRYGAIALDAGGVPRMWDSASPSGPWVQRGTVSYGDIDETRFCGVSWGDGLITFSDCSPTMLTYGDTCETLKDMSLLGNPTSLAFSTTQSSSTASICGYKITTVTPRGETEGTTAYAVNTATSWIPTRYDATGVAGINGSSLVNILSWNPVAAASTYRIYVYYFNATAQITDRTPTPWVPPSTLGVSWLRAAEVSANTTTWTDSGTLLLTDVVGNPLYCPITNTAYNTPGDWETNGYPTGGMVVARGQDERLFVWRKDTVWASSLKDALNWFTVNDAFVFTVNGGTDNDIVAGANLNEYIILWSKTDCFVYTGASASTISLQKIIPVGCMSAQSVQVVGTDVYLWSQFGPTSFKRILAGADISVVSKWNNRIKPILDTETNKDEWERISSYADIIKNRVVWSVPATSAGTNSLAIVYQWDVDAFTKYDNWGFHHCHRVGYNLFGVEDKANNWVVQLHSGNLDDTQNIEASYQTGWFDWGTWEMRKRVGWVDVVASREGGRYSFSFGWSWDYDRIIGDPVHCTEASTDGSQIETTSTLATHHRCLVTGIGNSLQLIFSSTAGDQDVKVLGWRPDARNRGIRAV